MKHYTEQQIECNNELAWHGSHMYLGPGPWSKSVAFGCTAGNRHLQQLQIINKKIPREFGSNFRKPHFCCEFQSEGPLGWIRVRPT